MTARPITKALLAVTVMGMCGSPARATDIYSPNSWSAMASDRQAQKVGDALTVIIYEASAAQNSAQAGSQKSTQLSGQVQAGANPQTGQLNLNGQFSSQAQTGRSGTLVAEISAVVDQVLPNGDLHIAGQQLIDVAGERTKISVKGRVRRADIAADNTVVSSRLADADIEYGGKGFLSKGAAPGLISRVVSWLGLL